MSIEDANQQLNKFYTDKLDEHGVSPLGVGWNSKDSQEIRFEHLLTICDASRPFSILDYGCGYGALADYLMKKGFQADYHGFDIIERMILNARQNHTGKPSCNFTTDESQVPVCDYVVASGIFNFCGDTDFEPWTEHVISILHRFDALSRKGFASNFLTKYSDADRMRPDLYYADPCYLFDYCKRNFSKNVALLHDYNLYDFTILVRKG